MAQNAPSARSKTRGLMGAPNPSSKRDTDTISTRPNRPTTAAEPLRETRSVSSASTSTAVSTRDFQTALAPPRSPSKRSKEHGSNIKVVVRCRGPSKAELKEGTPIVVATNGPRSEEVMVTTHDPSSLPRPYEFDQVFGPEADQSIIYQDVVVPILNEVFNGYSATLCAYGQTGTGKTFTMHGELNRQSSGALDTNAGIVPRVITRLFQRLDKDYTDFAVAISYMELYNEEIRDLLGPEHSPPLPVFDEPSKKGTVVKGLKEFPAKDVKSAIDILRMGNNRRQIAATKLNDRSSRSHSIFTISVTSATGSKDMFQIGRLNLVDLAGSEDIGRSGAENMRAKEAGLINRSLLTLGRVINALVDRVDKPNTHVPYRESVLTRVLQDALGGNTKTCIIATISPVRANLDETLSTLDYATRARSIKNNPEATRQVAKHTLLKDLVSEMDKLRADLMASREKNGRYLDEDRWEELQSERERLINDASESKRAREVTEARLLTLQEEFDHNVLLMERRGAELREAKRQLAQTEESLVQTTESLNTVTADLEEEIVVRAAYEENGSALNRVASGLRSVAQQGIQDIDGLFDKLERKSRITNSNIDQVKRHEHEIAKSIQDLTKIVETHHLDQKTFVDDIRVRAEKFGSTQAEAFVNDSKILEQHLTTLSERANVILTKESASAELCKALAQMILETSTSVRDDFTTWRSNLLQNYEALMHDLQGAWSAQITDATKSTQTFASLLEGIVRDIQDHADKERKSVLSVKSIMETSLSSEIQRLQQHNEQLLKFAKSEKAATDAMRDEVISQVSKLMHKHTERRDASIRETVKTISSGLIDDQQEMEKLKANHGASVNSILAHDKELLGRMEKKSGDGRKLRDDATRAFKELNGNVETGVGQMQDLLRSAISEQAQAVEQSTATLHAAYSGGFERLEKGRRTRVDEVTALRENSDQTREYLEGSMSVAAQSVNEVVDSIISAGSVVERSIETFRKEAGNQLGGLRHIGRSLGSHAAVEDLPTGKTPRKRKWEYEDDWEFIQDRADALKRRRRSAEEVPLPAEAMVDAEAEEEMPVVNSGFAEYTVPLAGEEELAPEGEEEAVVVATSALPVLEPAPRSKPPSVASLPRRRPTASQSGVPPRADKPTGIARVSRRVPSSGAGPPSGGTRMSGALAETSNASGRRREK